MENADAVLKTELEKLRRKASQQATAHSWLRDRYSFAANLMTTLSLVAGVFLLAIIMATPEFVQATLGLPATYYSWLAALLAASNFSVVVVLLSWRPEIHAAQHDQAVRHYTKTIYDCGAAIKSTAPLDERTVNALQERYLDDRDLPRIPEKWFLPLKKWHKEKLAASQALDKGTEIDLPSPPRWR